MLQEIKRTTLDLSLVKMLIKSEIKTQDDIVQVARVYMTDLEISFKDSLNMVNEVIETYNNKLTGIITF